MAQRKSPAITLEEAKARFEEWRQKRKGKAPIPHELWATAIEVARKEGINRTSTELRVEWNHPKRRMAETQLTSPKPLPPTAFVELIAPQTQSHTECTLEMEGRRGKLPNRFSSAGRNYGKCSASGVVRGIARTRRLSSIRFNRGMPFPANLHAHYFLATCSNPSCRYMPMSSRVRSSCADLPPRNVFQWMCSTSKCLLVGSAPTIAQPQCARVYTSWMDFGATLDFRIIAWERRPE